MIFPDHDVIQEGDFVVVYISPEQVSCHQIFPDLVIRNPLGSFNLGQAIGKSFGSHFWNNNHNKSVALLKVTPDLWTRCLPHRTQILYFADISLVLALLEVRPGTIVLECGTGSGSMTHSLAKAVGLQGRVHSFEFHPQRVIMAQKEFSTHGLYNSDDGIENEGWVSCEQRDVGALGFPEGLKATAIFLDLPNPWDVIPKLQQSLDRSKTSKVCCFSPCIEQVLKNHEAYRANGFVDIVMYETLQQLLQVIPMTSDQKRCESSPHYYQYQGDTNLITMFADQGRGHTSYLSFATLPASSLNK